MTWAKLLILYEITTEATSALHKPIIGHKEIFLKIARPLPLALKTSTVTEGRDSLNDRRPFSAD
jgi:hypothetical protein